MDTSPPGRLIALGKIVGTHGVRGFLRLHPANAASAASAVQAVDRTIFLSLPSRPDDPHTTLRALRLRAARPHGRLILLELEGVDDIDSAQRLVGSELSIPETDLPPPAPGEYYAYQLEGLEVVTVAGERLGAVASVMPTGSNDVLVVRDGRREHLIPVIADVIRAIDLEARRVTIEPLEGLLEER